MNVIERSVQRNLRWFDFFKNLRKYRRCIPGSPLLFCQLTVSKSVLDVLSTSGWLAGLSGWSTVAPFY